MRSIITFLALISSACGVEQTAAAPVSAHNKRASLHAPGAMTAGTIAKFDGSGGLEDSTITDDGSIVTFTSTGTPSPLIGNAKLAQLWNGQVLGNLVTSGTDGYDVQLFLVYGATGSTGHTSEAINFAPFMIAPVDTSSNAVQTFAIQAVNHAAKVAGSNALNDMTIESECSSPTADKCYDYFSTTGLMRHDGDQNFGGTTSVSNLYTYANASVDFTQSATVNLGSHIQPFTLLGSSSQTAAIGLGHLQVTDGTAIAIKNTQTNVATTGIDIGADSAINSIARAGLFLFRGANGGFGTANKTGLVRMGSAAFCTDGQAEDTCLFDWTSGANASIRLSTDGTNARSQVLLDGKGKWVLQSASGVAAQTGHLACVGAAPAITGCGTAAVVRGSDCGFWVTPGSDASGCTITFANPSATYKPSCTVFVEGGAGQPACTVSTSSISCTAVAAGTTMHWHCTDVIE
jgi:hypothetical protein